ncbi:MAG TPA: GNAT family N-acetyltransferase [Blastocatellia bacterium]|nr:GNAT family N-acetyltransferase [Blastocatellia bacterium]
MTLPQLHPPTLLHAAHRTDDFDSGVPLLDDWLRKRALKNQSSGASRTFVVCTDDDRVVGYYCLSAGSVVHAVAPKSLRRNMPDPIPVVVMGRLAIDQRYHRRGLGSGLLKDAVLRTLHSADSLGIVALLVHAVSEEAKDFYLANGFVESPTQPLTLCLALEMARKIILAP